MKEYQIVLLAVLAWVLYLVVLPMILTSAGCSVGYEVKVNSQPAPCQCKPPCECCPGCRGRN